MTRRLLKSGTTGIVVDIEADGSHREIARELEALGFDALWVRGGQLDRLDRVRELLDATAATQIGTAVLPLGRHAAADVAMLHKELGGSHPGRFVLGLGAPQQPRALAALDTQLRDLDTLGVRRTERLLAALGPRKVTMARDRCAGAITLLVTPEFTAQVRAELGPEPTLVVNQYVVLETDPHLARAAVRVPLSFLATVAGYRAAFRRMGFADIDADRLSDRLVDAVSVRGEVADIAAHVESHRRAGADHVVLNVLQADGGPPLLGVAGQLAAALGLGRQPDTEELPS